MSADAISERSNAASFWREFRLDLERSRRHGRSFALVRCTVRPRSTARLDAALSSSLRADDAFLIDGASLIFRFSEVNRDSALVAFERLQRVLGGAVHAAPAAVVVYPDDGLTSLALIARIYDRPLAGERGRGRQLRVCHPPSERVEST